MASIAVGNSVGKYRITELVGKGGMGAVYKAHDPDLERDVALKVMDPSLAHDEAFMKRFRVEAKALAQLNNTHIVKVHALQESEFGTCIIMEFVPGVTLSDIIKQGGALDRKRLFHLFRQIFTAFEYAHKAGVIHRDIKPGNIMITDADEVKVTDFGLAKLHRHKSATVTQLTGGTLYYVSPEQIEGLASLDHRGDIYSIGMTLYEALTGAIPFEHTESDFRIRERIVNGKIRPPQSFNAAIPKRLNDFVMKAIARRPEDRFQTVSEMLSSFDKVVEAERKEGAPGRRPPFWKENRPQKVLIWALSAGAAVLVGLLLMNVFRSKPAGVTSEPQKVETETAEKKKAGTEIAERERMNKEQAERERAAGEKADKEKADKEKADNEREVREKAGKGKVEKGKVVTEKSAKDKSEREKGKSIASREESVSRMEIPRNEKTNPVPAKLLEEKTEPERPKPAETAIHEVMHRQLAQLRDEYVSSLERKDINAFQNLLHFGKEESDVWKNFFESARDISVSVEQFKVNQTGPNTAEVTFRATIKYFNTTMDETTAQPMQNRWQCEYQGNRWRILGRKLN